MKYCQNTKVTVCPQCKGSYRKKECYSFILIKYHTKFDTKQLIKEN